MAVNVFTEYEVNSAVLKKAPHNLRSTGDHPIIELCHKGIMIDLFRIPNPHKRKAFIHHKGNALAKKLRLSHRQYDEFIRCHLDKKAYEKILDEILRQQNKLPSSGSEE
jgi:hypothetical protein